MCYVEKTPHDDEDSGDDHDMDEEGEEGDDGKLHTSDYLLPSALLRLNAVKEMSMSTTIPIMTQRQRQVERLPSTSIPMQVDI